MPNTQTPQMDNDVINLAKAIRQTESGGNFNAKGASGESGAYQWTPETWKAHAKQALNDEKAQMTPENQNAVAYTVLKSWKDQGLNPAQIAAKWNSGSETGWENKRGVNKFGVQYDVPKYVKSVTDAYQLTKQGGQPQIDPNNPSSIAGTQMVEPEKEEGGFFKNLVRSIASPIATTVARPFQAGAQLLGASPESVDKFSEKYSGGLVAPVPRNLSDVKKDIGRAGQTVAFGLGPVSGGTVFGTGLSLEQGNDILSKETALNAGLGLFGGKALDLVGKPLLNGAGVVIGKITPQILQDVASRGTGAVQKFMAAHKILPEGGSELISKGAQTIESVANAPFRATGNIIKRPFVSSPEQIIKGREKELKALSDNYSDLRKASSFSKDGGEASRKRIANSDVLVDAVDENGLIRTKNAVEQYRAQTIDEGEGVVRDLLEKEGASIDLDEVEKELRRQVSRSLLSGKDLVSALRNIDDEIAGLRLKVGKDGKLSLTELHDAKVNTTRPINYQTPPETATYRKAVARAYKKAIENKSRYNIKETNAELAKYYDDIDFLNKLDGKRVRGGKASKYFSQIAGNVAGGLAGGLAGGMTGSAIGTVVGGELASRIRGTMLSRVLGGATGKSVPKSEILEKAIAESKRPRLALPAPKSSIRSEIRASKPINLPAKTQTKRDIEESANAKIKTFSKGYKSKGKIEIKGVDSEGNIQIVDNGNVLVIPRENLPVIKFGKR